MLQKAFLFIVLFGFLSCSNNGDSSEQITPVNSTHLLWGKWNATKIVNYNGDLLFSECNISTNFIDFTNNDTAVWKRLRDNNTCISSNWVYDSWGVYANGIGYVRLYSQGTTGSSYNNCQVDLIGNNGLRLSIAQRKNGQTHEVIANYPVEVRYYYYFVKAN
jgi:hypothetical protein